MICRKQTIPPVLLLPQHLCREANQRKAKDWQCRQICKQRLVLKGKSGHRRQVVIPYMFRFSFPPSLTVSKPSASSPNFTT